LPLNNENEKKNNTNDSNKIVNIKFTLLGTVKTYSNIINNDNNSNADYLPNINSDTLIKKIYKNNINNNLNNQNIPNDNNTPINIRQIIRIRIVIIINYV
jgi:hypothetical protein